MLQLKVASNLSELAIETNASVLACHFWPCIISAEQTTKRKLQTARFFAASRCAAAHFDISHAARGARLGSVLLMH